MVILPEVRDIMAEGEATPVVEAKRLVERDDEGMSQSYHEIFDTQVNLYSSDK